MDNEDEISIIVDNMSILFNNLKLETNLWERALITNKLWCLKYRYDDLICDSVDVERQTIWECEFADFF